MTVTKWRRPWIARKMSVLHKILNVPVITMASNHLLKSALGRLICAVSRRKKETYLRNQSICTNALDLNSRFYRPSPSLTQDLLTVRSTVTAVPSLLQCTSRSMSKSCKSNNRAGVCKTRASVEYKPVNDESNFMWSSTLGFHSSSRRDHNQPGSEDVARTCWNCGRDTNPKTELFFCDCGVVQKPAEELTYFRLMQMQRGFDIDLKKLSYIFKETQKLLHPDKFSLKGKEEQKHAEKQSSLLNKAYSTLQKPLSRAIYLLQLENITITETDSITDPEFLMEIMEINEQISCASKFSDVEAIEVTNNHRITKCIDELKEYFSKNLLNDAKKLTIKLRYYTTIEERIKELHRRHLDEDL